MRCNPRIKQVLTGVRNTFRLTSNWNFVQKLSATRSDSCIPKVGLDVPTHLTSRLTRTLLALEICEYDRESPRDLIHIPRSVLLYIGAIDLGVDAMKTKILQILQQTAKDLVAYLQARKFVQAMSPQEVVEGVIHLRNALEVAYSSQYLTDMLPLRLALCQLLDTLLPFLIRHPVVIDLFSSNVWKKHADAISTDLLTTRNPEQQPARNLEMSGGYPRDEGPSHEKALSSCIENNAS